MSHAMNEWVQDRYQTALQSKATSGEETDEKTGVVMSDGTSRRGQ